jgi:2',3'-cyclic-nucleotide 2'-phosphodiesterase (5'-nucleotidase family)
MHNYLAGKRKRGAALLLSFAMVFTLATVPAPAETARAAGETPQSESDVVIVYTNDVHCGAQQAKDTGGVVTNIGYAGVAAYVNEAEDLVGAEHVTLVDAGDAVQGDAIGTLSRGQYLVDIMNFIGYDVFVPGNHEFDYGMARMAELMNGLNAEVVSSNFTDLANNKLVHKPYTVIDYGDTEIAYVGITTPESFTKSTPAYFQDAQGEYIYGFKEGGDGAELYAAVQGAVDAARAELASDTYSGARDIVIAVGHLGVDAQSAPWRSVDVIANTSGIDAFIDGHSHSVTESDRVKNKKSEDVLLTQTGTKLAHIGRMTISAEDGSVTAELVTGYGGQDADALAYIDGIYAEFAADLAEKVGETRVALTTTDPATGARIVRSRETNLGDLAADAYRFVLGNGKTGAAAGPADIAFVNGGGIRVNIDAGDISFGEVIAVHPFNNVGCVVEATGQEILDALETASRSAPNENGGFLQVSGLSYAIDTTVPSSVVTDDKGMFVSVAGARRVKDVKVGDAPIDAAKIYTLASHNYMLLDGGDGINMFRDNEIVVQPVILDNQILIRYIQEYLDGTVGEDYAAPYGAGRIRVLLAETPAAGFENAGAALALTQLARYSSGSVDADGGVCEIVAYSASNGYAYAVNGRDGVLTAIDLGALSGVGGAAQPGRLTGADIDVAALARAQGLAYGDLTSVAVSPDGSRLAAAVQAAGYADAGRVVIFSLGADGALAFEAAYETGVQPDMVTFVGDGTVLTADEGEPREGYGAGATDPKGSVTIVTVAEGGGGSKVVYFDAFDAQRDALAAAGAVLKKGTAPSVDLEPEYIAVAEGRAYVTLQEANAVAVLDIANGVFTDIQPLGLQDYAEVAVDFDNSSESDGGAYSPANYAKTFGVRMPDGIAAYRANGKTYIATANEGDARDWEGYINEAEYKIKTADGAEMTKKGRFLTADYDGLPGITGDKNGVNYAFGARSFSLFEATADGLALVYDSGNDFERLTADYLPEYFNCSSDDTERDSRSNKKGPEPETIAIGAVGGRTYAFVTLERIGGVMVYDLSDPQAVRYVNYINSRDYENAGADGIGRDDSAEGLCFVPASASPTGEALLIAAFEVSGDVSVYALTPKNAEAPRAAYKVVFDANGGSVSPQTAVTDAQGRLSLPAPTRGGAYTFDGWYTAVSGGERVTNDSVFTADATIFARWIYTGGTGGVSSGPGAGASSAASAENAASEESAAAAASEEQTSAASPAPQYADVNTSDWFCEAVQKVSAAGLMKGTGAGFEPQTVMTRAMLITVLARAAGVDTSGGETWYGKAVDWAKANGVSDGASPGGEITREQIVTMLWRRMGEPAPTADTAFSDADGISAWARDAVRWAVESGVIVAADSFRPKAGATRAEAAAMISRWLSR